MLKDMLKKNYKFILLAVIALIGIFGVSYAFYEFYYTGNNHELIVGNIYLKLNDGTTTLSLPNVFPETAEEARNRSDNEITFSIKGINTTKDNDIYYEILLNEGDEDTTKTRFKPEHLVFDLIEIDENGNENWLVNAQSYNDFNARKIWVNTVNRDTTTEINRTYKLRMWLSEDVFISNTNPNADYTADDYKNRYATVKVAVYGDFVPKSNPYNYMTRFGTVNMDTGEIAFWPENIETEKANITSINFAEMKQDTLLQRYNTATIKADVTDTTKSDSSSVLAWLETNEDNTYTMYVASDGITYFPSDCSAMFAMFENLTSIHFKNVDTKYMTNMMIMFSMCPNLTNLDVSGFNTSNVISMTGTFAQCSSLINLDLGSFDTAQVTDMTSMFAMCSSLTNLNLAGFDTSQVVGMGNMFSGCSDLTSLDLSGFDTSNITDMSFMFGDCFSLKSIDVSNFNTGKVTLIQGMFCNCSSLNNLDLSNFDISNITNFILMFDGCSGLTSLDLSGWNVNSITVFSLSELSSVVDLNLSNWDISGLTSLNSLLQDCTNLKNLDLSNWDTSNITNMGYMFSGCSSLTNIDISDWDTSNVTIMTGMFYGCNSLTSLDLTNWNVKNVTNFTNMFYSCSNLASIYAATDWNTVTVTSSSDMFSDCTNLVGGVPYDSSKVDITMANPTTGYFTIKSSEEITS